MRTLDQAIREESLQAVVNVGGDYNEFLDWNKILALFGLEPIDSFVVKSVDVH